METTGFQDADWNFRQAVAVGALSATDPMPGCSAAILTAFSITPLPDVPTAPGTPPPAPVTPPIPQFTPLIEQGDIFSPGSVAYIRAQQLKALVGAGAAGLTIIIPDKCKILWFNAMMDLTKLNLKAAKTAIGLGGASMGIPPILSTGLGVLGGLPPVNVQ